MDTQFGETFAQIEGAASHSIGNVNVSITNGGSIIGQGVTASAGAIEVCGGNLDNILRSFGGVEGGDTTFGGKASSVIKKTSSLGSKLSDQLEKKLNHIHDHASDLETLASMAKSALHGVDSEESKAVLEKIVSHIDMAARSIRGTVDKEIDAPKQSASDFIDRNGRFIGAIKSLGANVNETTKAGMLSLSFTSVNELKKLANKVKDALKVVDMKKNEYFGSSLSSLDAELTKQVAKGSMKNSELKEFLKAWSTLVENYGHRSELKSMVGGSATTKLVDRLADSRKELKDMINKFIDAFGININGIVSSTNELAVHLGKDIPYSDDTVVFLDTFFRLSENLNNNVGKIYQHLLELNTEQVDSKEIKDRFLSSMRDLAERIEVLGSQASIKSFAQHCRDTIGTINKFNDMIKTHRDTVKKQGGSTDSMNELFSVDATKIDISGLRNPLENLLVAIKKVKFFKNIAVFRSNLQQTNKELAVYSKDYTKSVGQAIGEAINKIKNEYTDIINQISDNKSGMGLEIDMYNESLPKNGKISKEKLKIIYKWQCDARIGLYKTVEAIDLYLLHFTESITKNPDAVSDLHKMLSATKIISRWYDAKAGDNLIRMFESFGPRANIDADNIGATYANDADFADLEAKVGGDRANQIYERTRRAIEGVVVLKNIISYFISIGEKYGDFKSEKNIYMAPSNIYKNLVNYLWVSALDVNTTGTEVLTDNNETKRLITYEDTKVRIAQVTTIDPTVMGINFNKHSMDKLRIMKSHNELLRLKDFTASMTDPDLQRVKQFVSGVFARLGKTDYIFEMLPFGVYDISQMDQPMIKRFLKYAYSKTINGLNNKRSLVVIKIGAGATVQVNNSDDDQGELATNIAAVPANERATTVTIKVVYAPLAGDRQPVVDQAFVPLSIFLASGSLASLNAMSDIPIDADGVILPSAPATNALSHSGFLSGFLTGLTSNSTEVASVSYAQRSVAALHYCIMNMLNKYKKDHSSSVFAIDDTYFILTIKAIAGKIMAVTGVNSLFKKPSDHANSVMQNQTRLIMGGAEGDVDIIDDAVELYVRLPLLVEFYRHIFDSGNKEYKGDNVTDVLDEEQVSFVPEIGNVWSGLIINIFDKSKHIDNGVYTSDNMRKIVSEVNSIYKHYKGSVAADQLVRHIMVELVAEINRRYGVIKRQELLQYYRVVNATKTTNIDISESNYSNNDFDILNEAIEFEEKSPSDEFIKFKSSIADPSTPHETKVNRLTDYAILKNFREKISNMMGLTENDLHNQGRANEPLLSIVERVRMLKRAITSKTSREEKYDMIIKAIDEADSMNQSSNDIFVCFHEFVITPLRTAYQMYRALDLFLVNMFTLLKCAEAQNIAEINTNPIFASRGKNDVTVRDALESIARSRHYEIVFPGTTDLLIGGVAGALTFNLPAFNVTGVGGIQGTQLAMINALMQFATNSGNLVKLNVSTTASRITVDFSEYQKVCEYLVANVKYMIDKFTGLVPTGLLNKVSSRERGGVYWLEDKMINQMFNKLNKTESQREFASLDNLNKLMPLVSKAIFGSSISSDALVGFVALNQNAQAPVEAANAMPIIRDAFMVYSQKARMFITHPAPAAPAGAPAPHTYISRQLFNADIDSSLNRNQSNTGIVQEFNILISQYLNHMYDAQSRKIYTKAFATFAGSALIDAINGQSFPDFSQGAAAVTNNNNAPKSQVVLSATLAYVMKTLSNRVHPTTGMKVHEVTSLQEVSPQVLEKYRTMIPMYLRIFKLFVNKCRLYRKMLGNMTVVNPLTVIVPNANSPDTNVKEAEDETGAPFSNGIGQSLTGSGPEDVKDTVSLYLDEIVNSMSSLIQDVEAVQKELLETDSTVSLYFDMKKDFTKNYFSSSKELPFAPLSVLTMGFKNIGDRVKPPGVPAPRTPSTNGILPLYDTSRGADHVNNKFLYGLRSLLVDDFKMSSTKLPYLKTLINDFNGYTTKSNNISEAKFNDVLGYVGKAMNYIYDLRFFNGQAISHCDVFNGSSLAQAAAQYSATPGAPPASAEAARIALNTDLEMLYTYQEVNPKNRAMTLIESVNVIESRNKVADYVKHEGNVAKGPLAPVPAGNPRARVVMVNLVDLNIMPINVHSLMREIPLANLYNYAMTFDTMVDTLSLDAGFTAMLKKPYNLIQLNRIGTEISIDGSDVTISGLANNDTGLRFIKDMLVQKVMKINDATMRGANPGASAAHVTRINQRLNSKIYHNLFFLTLVQYAIKKKVKSELEFINTRVVSDVNAVSNVITNAQVDGVDVSDDVFEF